MNVELELIETCPFSTLIGRKDGIIDLETQW
jgi:hypothetical protein